MDAATARAVILRHCEVGDPPGILDKLRPFEGVSDEDFVELVTAILAVGIDLRRPESFSLVVKLWKFSWYVRTWAVSPSGALQRNKLIDQPYAERIGQWIDIVERITLQLAGVHSLLEASFTFICFVAEGNPVTLRDEVLSHFAAALRDSREEFREMAAKALGVLGSQARFARPALVAATSDPDVDVAREALAALEKIGA